MAYETINYENFYTGGYSSLNPEYGNFVGYRLPFGQLSSTTSMQVANQVNEVVSRIREGVKNVEIQQIQPDVFEQIPKEQFAEIKAIMKLTGVRPSLHAPMIDPAGFDPQRGYQGELGREDAERRLFDVVKRGHQMDINGNMPVVIHSSAGIPGTEWRPEKEKKPGEKGRFRAEEIIVIDQESGEMQKLKRERVALPELTEEELKKHEIKERIFTPEERLYSVNKTKWEQELTNLAFYKKHADEIIGNAPAFLARFSNANADEKTIANMSPQERIQYNKLREAEIFLDNVRMNFNNSFEKAYKYGTPQQKKALMKIAEDYTREMKKVEGKIWQPIAQKELLDKAINGLRQVTTMEKKGDKIVGFGPPPQILVNVEDFAMKKSAETIGNVAFKSYKKWGEKAPIMAVENWQPGAAFSRAEDLKNLIEESKRQFEKNIMEKEKVSKAEAKRIADKLIGATWDTGHINQLRKWGFTEEDIIKETEKIAKLVKHVHLSDNFGYTDSHLAPGMGDVPFKKIFEKLKKAGALEKAKAVIEAGALVNPNLGLKMSPLKATLHGLGPGAYEAALPPYWNTAMGMVGGYVAFPLAYMPEKHFSVYEVATGFAGLPQELGGAIPGTRSRFSGTANA